MQCLNLPTQLGTSSIADDWHPNTRRSLSVGNQLRADSRNIAPLPGPRIENERSTPESERRLGDSRSLLEFVGTIRVGTAGMYQSIVVLD